MNQFAQRAYDLLRSKSINRAVIGIIIADMLLLVGIVFRLHDNHHIAIVSLNTLSLCLFAFEYLLRIAAAPIDSTYSSPLKARIRYIFSFIGFIDLFAVLLFIAPLLDNFSRLDMSRFHETTRLLLIFKLIRRSFSFRLIIQSVRMVRTELTTLLSATGLVVLIAGVLMYYIERDAQPDKFYDIKQGVWWAVITFATVGYGDIYPITQLGKLIAMGLSLLGIGIIALPSALIGSAFRNIVSEQKRKQELGSTLTDHQILIERIDQLEKALERIEQKIESK